MATSAIEATTCSCHMSAQSQRPHALFRVLCCVITLVGVRVVNVLSDQLNATQNDAHDKTELVHCRVLGEAQVEENALWNCLCKN
ncbi:hypothetical protein NPIL_11671 [Nephila pilipes]|uniref:Uncharacterized protein n=1 Tax=Nephila pilipes TaxID=299642 RepID=A0A8X6MVY4_NEPPI|nr:hypothetical protein NPIL_11671 [Nephila pilipes]